MSRVKVLATQKLLGFAPSFYFLSIRYAKTSGGLVLFPGPGGLVAWWPGPVSPGWAWWPGGLVAWSWWPGPGAWWPGG